MSVLAPPEGRVVRLDVDLLTQSIGLRTALRRAINSASTDMRLTTNEPRGFDGSDGAGAPRTRAVILDADMPVVGGSGLMEQLASIKTRMPAIVVARDTVDGRRMREKVLRAGANHFFLRPDSEQPRDLKSVALAIVEALGEVRTGKGQKPPPGRTPTRNFTQRKRFVRPKALVIGSSTGGPQALIAVFKAFPPDKVQIPVLVVQHMPATFTPILAEHITRATGWRATEAADGDPLTPGEVRIAPGGKHLVVGGPKHSPILNLTEDPPVNFCRPAADVLFVSAAASFGSAVVATVLTGMGHDGADGVKAIKAVGGTVFAQDEATSVVWGMPGAAVATGAVDKVLPLAEIGPALHGAIVGVGQ